MNVNELTIKVSYSLPGCIKNLGKYTYREKTNKGNYLSLHQRLLTNKPVEYDTCTKSIVLGPAFISHAISKESRPSRRNSNALNLKWKVMSAEQRLDYHIKKYVSDMCGELISYEII